MKLLLVVVVLALAAPSAFAAWSSKGTREPDDARDVSDKWMFVDPEKSADQSIRQVYFNGFVGQYQPLGNYAVVTTEAFGGQTLNPNVAPAQSGILPPSYYFVAILGVWKDCNLDGYIGWGDAGLLEYRAELLGVVTSVCPASTTPVTPPLGKPPMDWFPSHNDAQWVRELLPIQWVKWDAAANGGDPNPYNVNDNASRVWADVGLPTSQGAASATCEYTPYGMGRSTGGTLRWLDCYSGYRLTDNYDALVAAAGGDGLGAGQLSFKDKPRQQDQSASALNQKNPWGKESDGSMVDVWDCDAAQVQHVKVNDDVDANVSMPRAPAPRAGGSLAGTANATGSGLDECHRTTTSDGHSHWGQSAAHAPYATEAEQSVGAALPKTQTDIMRPAETIRPSGAFGQLGRATPPDLGAREAGDDGSWTASGRTCGYPVRADVNKPFASTFLTYYASVSAAAITKYHLKLPNLAKPTDLYGRESCGTIAAGQPVRNGWDCNPDHWWTDESGADLRPRSGQLADAPGGLIDVRVGASYNLRDIDCYDFSLNAARGAGFPGALSGNACSPPAS